MAISSSLPSSSQSTTCKRIPTRHVRPGMFLVRVLDSWWKSPFYSHRREIRSEEEVQQLIQSGIQEIEIDTSKGVDVSPETAAEASEDLQHQRYEAQIPMPHSEADSQEKKVLFPTSECTEKATQEQLVRLRGDTIEAVEKVFEGVKTGRAISEPALHATAQELVRKALAHPMVLAEIILIDSLQQFDKTLYAHVIDTAVISILVGSQLGWEVVLLEEVCIAGLLHDVGYMRLPKNVVKTRWSGTVGDNPLLQQHVDIGIALIQKNSQFSRSLIQIIREHHAYQDGSGYSRQADEVELSSAGLLLGVADYFDELITGENPSNVMSAAMAIRRMYQEATKGKFPAPFIEAMVRTFGVFPVGTFVKLSTGEEGLVVKQNLEISVKPQVKILRARNGRILDEPKLIDLALDADLAHDVSIAKTLDSPDPSFNLCEYF